MRNLTLAIDEETLLRARKVALDQGTSVNELVRGYLGDLVQRHSRRRAARERLRRALAEKRVEVGGRTWTREELHER